MKRFLSLMLALAMVFTLAACGSSSSDSSDDTDTEETETEEEETEDESEDEESTDEESTEEESDEAEAESTSSDAVYGGDLVVYIQEFYNNYDPSMANNCVHALWYEFLFGMDYTLDDTGEVYSGEYMGSDIMTGQLAESYTFEDGVLTIQLRQGVYFQTLDDEYDYYGGRELTAEDVKWSYDRLLGTGSGYDEPYECDADWVSLLYMIDSIETDGDYTVIFNFNTTSELALDAFMANQVCIAGPEWDELTEDQQSDWHYACGTGPYILDTYEADNYMYFVKNENYWGTDEREGYEGNQLPYIDTITLQLISDSTNVVSQFMAGNLDVISWGGNVLSSTEAELLADSMDEDEYVQYTSYQSPTNIGLKQSSNEALADVNVRTALQYAVDMDACQTYLGYDLDDLQICGVWALSTNYSSVDEWDDELMASYTDFDLEKAEELLEEAGYADGFSFSVAIFANLDQGLFELVASQLAEINVTMDIYMANDAPEMQSLGHDLESEYSIMASAGTTKIDNLIQYYTEGGSQDGIGWSDETFESLIADFQASETMEEAYEIGKELDTYWAEQHLCLYLGGAEQINSFFSSRIQGYNGERLFKNWNSAQIFSHMWLSE